MPYQGPVRPGDDEKTFRDTGKSAKPYTPTPETTKKYEDNTFTPRKSSGSKNRNSILITPSSETSSNIINQPQPQYTPTKQPTPKADLANNKIDLMDGTATVMKYPAGGTSQTYANKYTQSFEVSDIEKEVTRNPYTGEKIKQETPAPVVSAFRRTQTKNPYTGEVTSTYDRPLTPNERETYYKKVLIASDEPQPNKIEKAYGTSKTYAKEKLWDFNKFQSEVSNTIKKNPLNKVSDENKFRVAQLATPVAFIGIKPAREFYGGFLTGASRQFVDKPISTTLTYGAGFATGGASRALSSFPKVSKGLNIFGGAVASGQIAGSFFKGDSARNIGQSFGRTSLTLGAFGAGIKTGSRVFNPVPYRINALQKEKFKFLPEKSFELRGYNKNLGGFYEGAKLTFQRSTPKAIQTLTYDVRPTGLSNVRSQIAVKDIFGKVKTIKTGGSFNIKQTELGESPLYFKNSPFTIDRTFKANVGKGFLYSNKKAIPFNTASITSRNLKGDLQFKAGTPRLFGKYKNIIVGSNIKADIPITKVVNYVEPKLTTGKYRFNTEFSGTLPKYNPLRSIDRSFYLWKVKGSRRPTPFYKAPEIPKTTINNIKPFTGSTTTNTIIQDFVRPTVKITKLESVNLPSAFNQFQITKPKLSGTYFNLGSSTKQVFNQEALKFRTNIIELPSFVSKGTSLKAVQIIKNEFKPRLTSKPRLQESFNVGEGLRITSINQEAYRLDTPTAQVMKGMRLPSFKPPRIQTPTDFIKGFKLPGLGFDDSSLGWKNFKGGAKVKYRPDYKSLILGIRGKAPKRIVTGEEARPITKGFSFEKLGKFKFGMPKIGSKPSLLKFKLPKFKGFW